MVSFFFFFLQQKPRSSSFFLSSAPVLAFRPRSAGQERKRGKKGGMKRKGNSPITCHLKFAVGQEKNREGPILSIQMASPSASNITYMQCPRQEKGSKGCVRRCISPLAPKKKNSFSSSSSCAPRIETPSAQFRVGSVPLLSSSSADVALPVR